MKWTLKAFSTVFLAALFIVGCSKTEEPVLLSGDKQGNDSALDLRSGESYPWRGHAAPFDFLFGNHIDTHQQSKVSGNGDKNLQGFFYIRFTGGEVQGLPVAKHGNCNMQDDCTVGWMLHGIKVKAKLIKHCPGEHPLWYIDPADMPSQPGFTHFHWLNGADHAGGLSHCTEYDGYLLKLTARESFYFEHHGGFAVTPGIDYLTHANIANDPTCMGHSDCPHDGGH